MYFHYFVTLLWTLKKGVAHHLNKLESPSPENALCQVWLKLAQCVWRRRWKCEKFTTTMTKTRTENRQISIRKLTWAFSSGDLKWRYDSSIESTFDSNYQYDSCKAYPFTMCVINVRGTDRCNKRHRNIARKVRLV